MPWRSLCHSAFPSVSNPLIQTISQPLLIVFRCWDGVNLDSSDHQSHMYNTITQDGFVNAGTCPSSHPVRMPQVSALQIFDLSVQHLF